MLIAFNVHLFKQHDILEEPPQNLMNDDNLMTPVVSDRREFEFLQNKNDQSYVGDDEFGLIDDIFMVNSLSSSVSPSSLGDSPIFSLSDDDAMDIMKPIVDESKPFESFEKQITITVPQPPPLKTDAISIGGGLFQGKFSKKPIKT